MFQEDQDDRKPGLHGIDWAVVKPRDDARLERTRQLYAAGGLRTGADWFHAALILQHSSEADDYLLAHEMCIAAVAKGEMDCEVASCCLRGPLPDEDWPETALRHAVRACGRTWQVPAGANGSSGDG
jgi:hypothetical protein